MPATETLSPENDEPTAKRAKTDAPDEASDTPSGTAGAAAGGTGAASDQLTAASDQAAATVELQAAATEAAATEGPTNEMTPAAAVTGVLLTCERPVSSKIRKEVIGLLHGAARSLGSKFNFCAQKVKFTGLTQTLGQL